MPDPKGSAPLSFSGTDLKAVLREILLLILAAVLTYVTDHIASWDFGEWNALVLAGWRAFVEFVRRWLPDTRRTK